MTGIQLPGLGGPRDASVRVRALVRAKLGDADLKVLVTERTCTEPGCPPTETVIALMYPGAPRQLKIHRPLRIQSETVARRSPCRGSRRLGDDPRVQGESLGQR